MPVWSNAQKRLVMSVTEKRYVFRCGDQFIGRNPYTNNFVSERPRYFKESERDIILMLLAMNHRTLVIEISEYELTGPTPFIPVPFSPSFYKLVDHQQGWTSVVTMAEKLERKRTLPKYLVYVEGSHNPKKDHGVALLALSRRKLYQTQYTTMAISNDMELMKVRLYCPNFVLLYNYETGEDITHG